MALNEDLVARLVVNQTKPHTRLAARTLELLPRYGVPVLARQIGNRETFRHAAAAGLTVGDLRSMSRAKDPLHGLAASLDAEHEAVDRRFRDAERFTQGLPRKPGVSAGVGLHPEPRSDLVLDRSSWVNSSYEVRGHLTFIGSTQTPPLKLHPCDEQVKPLAIRDGYSTTTRRTVSLQNGIGKSPALSASTPNSSCSRIISRNQSCVSLAVRRP